MDDESEAEYLARNNMLILREMSLLKQQLFGNEASSSSPVNTTRSLSVSRSGPRSSRSASQGLNTTEHRSGEALRAPRDFSASSQREASRSPRPFLQKPILEKFPESERRMQDTTPMSSPMRKTIGSPTVVHPVSTPTNLEAALNVQSPRRFGGRSHTVENPPIPVVTRQPKQSRPGRLQVDSVLTPHSSARYGNQHNVEREGQTTSGNWIPRKLSPLEILLSASESNSHSEWVPEPSLLNSPRKSRVETNGGTWGRERSRPAVPLFDPSEYPNHSAEQSTWVNETVGNYLPATISNQLSPNDAVIVSPSDHSFRSSSHHAPREYPDMFTEFRRKWAEEDRNKEMQERFRTSQQTNLNCPSLEDIPRRSILLPPQSKGRKKSESDPRCASANSIPIDQDVWNFAQPSQRPSAIQQEEQSLPNINLASLTPEACEGKSFAELQHIVNQFYESSPRLKFKETYPYMAEGMVQKDCQTKMLKVFSSRLGRTMFTDARNSTSDDYVYFLVVGPGEFRGFYYDTHPKCLISAKFPSVERLVVRGYAILAHPNSRADSLKESRWICWNDSLGLMSIISGAARIPLKKQPVWDKQLDIISIHANFENNKFVVTKIVALTNSGEKKQQFPNEVFLIRDPVYVNTVEDDVIFSSKTLNRNIHIKRVLVGEVDLQDNAPFELVVVPTFPKSTTLQFRALLLIHMPSTFWSRDKEWIREILVKKTESYRY